MDPIPEQEQEPPDEERQSRHHGGPEDRPKADHHDPSPRLGHPADEQVLVLEGEEEVSQDGHEDADEQQVVEVDVGGPGRLAGSGMLLLGWGRNTGAATTTRVMECIGAVAERS